MERDLEMSSLAQKRKAALLPELLGAVRGRRRRRVATRVTVVAGMALLLISYWPAMVVPGIDSRQAGGDAALQVANTDGLGPSSSGEPFACEVVHDIPGVVQRYRSVIQDHQDWFVNDAELQSILRAAGRPAGIMRIAGKVTVARGALDPLPALGED
jgi:hypothetical protein